MTEGIPIKATLFCLQPLSLPKDIESLKRIQAMLSAQLLNKMGMLPADPFADNHLTESLQFRVSPASNKTEHGDMEIYTDFNTCPPVLRYRVQQASQNKFHPAWGILSSHLQDAGKSQPNFDMGADSSHMIRICLPTKKWADCNRIKGMSIVGLAFHQADKWTEGTAEGRVELLTPPLTKPTLFRPQN